MTEIKKITPEMVESLKADFPEGAIKPHPTKSFLSTLKAYHVTNRLNEVFGVGRWEIKTEVVERTDDYVLVKGRFIAYDYDVQCTEQYGGHKTQDKNTDIADGYKSAVTDCQSKIASYLGVGHSLFMGEAKAPKTPPAKRAPANKYDPKLHTTWKPKEKLGAKFKETVEKFEAKGGGYDSKIGFYYLREENGSDSVPEYPFA